MAIDNKFSVRHWNLCWWSVDGDDDDDGDDSDDDVETKCMKKSHFL